MYQCSLNVNGLNTVIVKLKKQDPVICRNHFQDKDANKSNVKGWQICTITQIKIVSKLKITRHINKQENVTLLWRQSSQLKQMMEFVYKDFKTPG